MGKLEVGYCTKLQTLPFKVDSIRPTPPTLKLHRIFALKYNIIKTMYSAATGTSSTWFDDQMISKIFCTKVFYCYFKTLLLQTKILRSELSVLSFCRLNKEYRHPVEWPLRSSLTLLPYFGAKLKQSLWRRGGRLSFHKRNTSKIILLNSTEEGRTGVARSWSSSWSKLN